MLILKDDDPFAPSRRNVEKGKVVGIGAVSAFAKKALPTLALVRDVLD